MSASRLEVLVAETGLDPADQQAVAVLEEMLALVPDEAPRPSAELQAVLDGGPSVARRSGHSLGTGVAAGLISLAVTVGVGGVAAAANELPPRMQRVVSEWSHRHLPFTFPMPDRAPDVRSLPGRPAPAARALAALPATHRLPASTARTVGHRDAGAAARPAARPETSSSAAQGVPTSDGRHAVRHVGGSSSLPSTARSAPRGPRKEPGSAGHHGRSGSKGEHPTGRPADAPSAHPQRQHAEHRPDEKPDPGASSGHRRSVPGALRSVLRRGNGTDPNASGRSESKGRPVG